MRRFVVVIFAVVGLVFAASLGLLLAMKRAQGRAAHFSGSSSNRSADPLRPDENVRDLSVPPFTLTDQEGRPFTNDIFAGKVTIVDFFFTHCKLICPALVQHMQDQQRALNGTGVRLLSISVDPEHDTPQVLKAYAQQYQVGPGWLFLNAKLDDVDLLSKKLGLYSEPNPENKDGHMPTLLIGNEATGQWIRGSALDNPQFTATMIGN